ncbi:DASH complex subunit Dam1-domain-containing protein [Apiospora arundinis]|uniref:DASH complex subunit DAM1 n=1 Tax=Apiospora arundinis TaxID=335852 RepID=A0ABR2HLH3_9PEZI
MADSHNAPRPRSTSRSRPTTPLRPSSRSSFRESAQRSVEGGHEPFPLNTFEPVFAELSDAVADLEANMMHFQLMHESLARFSEDFASFLYGLNMNAFCVDFPEGPIAESFRRARQQTQQEPAPAAPAGRSRSTEREVPDGETTFMTTDFSFVENPSATSKPTPKKFSTPAPRPSRQSRMPQPSRGASSSQRGRSGIARGRGSALPRGRGVR